MLVGGKRCLPEYVEPGVPPIRTRLPVIGISPTGKLLSELRTQTRGLRRGGNWIDWLFRFWKLDSYVFATTKRVFA